MPDDAKTVSHTPPAPRGKPDRVLLISMPFGALERPALSLGLIQAHCQRLDVPCETRYLTFAFAERIGLDNYLWLCSREVPYTAFVGDWLFTEALYGRRPYADAAYFDEVVRRTWRLADSVCARLLLIRQQVEPFLDDCLQTIPWTDHTLVGFTSVFQQNIASLALAARVKQHYPDITIAFGGANWEDVMGIALQEHFPFVDLAFSSEADISFPQVLDARRRDVSIHGIHGVSITRQQRYAHAEPPKLVRDLNQVPVPDFDPFFAQKQRSPSVAGLASTLLMETARGCWWGERSHCTFCGLNGTTMAFRSKTPERVLAEINELWQRYGISSISVVDDILDMRFFQTVLPRLAEVSLGIEFFWEVKANLTAQHVRQLRDAGIRQIQPGIESISDHVLTLMRKGTTAFRNIELLKWCREYGVKPYWNFLYGFPGETADDYTESMDLIHAIWHLDPPTGYGPIRLDRFSPYHANPTEFGMMNIRPMAPFSYLYPFAHSKLMDIAYYFDFDYVDGRSAEDYAEEAVALVCEWMADERRGELELIQSEDGTLTILDTRRALALEPRRAVLRDWKGAVYLACDRAQTFTSLMSLPEVQRAGVPQSEVRTFLDRCIRYRFMVHNGKSWLGVAVHTPARELVIKPIHPGKAKRQTIALAE